MKHVIKNTKERFLADTIADLWVEGHEDAAEYLFKSHGYPFDIFSHYNEYEEEFQAFLDRMREENGDSE